MSLQLVNKAISTEWIAQNAGQEAIEALGLNVDQLAEKSVDVEYKETSEDILAEQVVDEVEADESSTEDATDLLEDNEGVVSEVEKETTNVNDFGDLPEAITLITSAISKLGAELKQLNEKMVALEKDNAERKGLNLVPEAAMFSNLVKSQLNNSGFDDSAEVKANDELLNSEPEVVENTTQKVAHELSGLIEGI